MKQCEKIDLNSPNCMWKALPDMKEDRFWFNPCLFSGYVYVCGKYSRLVEAFCPQTDSFLPFQVQLPEREACCLFVHNDLLIVHSYTYISKFTAEHTGQLFQHSQIRSQTPSDKCSNSPPAVNSTRGLYFLIWNGVVRGRSLETGLLS